MKPDPSSLDRAREMFLLLWAATSRYVRIRIGFALSIIVTTSIVSALIPVVLKIIVDRFTGHAAQLASVPVLALLGIYLTCQWLARMLGELRGFIHAQADRRMYRILSDRLFSHLMQLPLRFHLERQTGALNATLANGLSGYQTVLQTLAYTFLPIVVELATVAIILVSLHQAALMGVFFTALAFYAAAFAYGTVRITATARVASTAQIDATGIMTDSILNYETVKCFTAEPIVRAKFDRALSYTESAWMAFFRSRTANGMLVGTIFSIFLAVTLGYSAQQVLHGQMTIGTFILINTYTFQLVSPIEALGSAVQQLSQGLVFLEKLYDLFREKPEMDIYSSADIGPGNKADGSDRPGELVFERVSASYRSDRAILNEVSFRVPSGKTVGIVGASGAGKSTMVRLLMRFIEPDGGRILLDGVPIAGLSLPGLRRAIAVVPQDTVLFNDTIGYNIGFGRFGSSKEEIERAAKLARLEEFIKRLPDGYDTRVGERGVKLSGGERQRVSIARAAIKHPKIYIFDEATSSLDSGTEKQIMRNLREISRQCTTLIIAHRLSTIVHADEIVVLHDGCVAERGTHAALVGLNGRYAALWEAQQSNEPSREPDVSVA